MVELLAEVSTLEVWSFESALFLLILLMNSILETGL